ncbi:hypothetical protein P43SY_004270 [Pythium insidiosum]|uniref:Hexose transporter 1 n=1 Tax=Pythium insidiosum TaxID=114742 RepID=A0AAD5Q5Z1_PYTIN|nr:hypothetical protein P43SY_004270 [Pythium insidiosum]
MAPSARPLARKTRKAAGSERYQPVETTTPTAAPRRLPNTTVNGGEAEHGDATTSHSDETAAPEHRRGATRSRGGSSHGDEPDSKRSCDGETLLQVGPRSDFAADDLDDDGDDNDDDEAHDLVEIAIGARRQQPPAAECAPERWDVPWMQVAVCALSAISGFLFGYDLCVMVIALPLIQTAFELSTETAEAVVSILMVGAVFGSLIGGVLADRLGRKRAIMLTGLFFLLGSVCMTFATSIYVMLLGRLLAGLAVGSSGPCVSTYVAEIARPEQRGALVTINEVMLCVGCLVSVAAGALLRESQRDRTEEARGVLRRLFPTRNAVDMDADIKAQLAAKGFHHGVWDALHEIATNEVTRRRVVLSLGVAFAHTLTGANAMLYYSSYIINSLSSGSSSFHGVSKELGVAVAKLAGVCTAILVVDKIGRRTLVLVGSSIMVLADLLFAACFWSMNGENASENHERLGIATLYLFIYAWNFSWAPLMWVICSEVLPDDMRSIGMGLTFAVYWLGSSLVNQTLLTVFQALGMCGSFLAYACLTAATIVFVVRKVPETRGLSFEQITSHFTKTPAA